MSPADRAELVAAELAEERGERADVTGEPANEVVATGGMPWSEVACHTASRLAG